MRLPKGVTLINMACLEEVLEAEMLEVLSARTDFCYISDAPHRECRGSQSPSQADTAHIMVPAVMTPRASYDSSARRRAEEASKDSAGAVQKGSAMISARRRRRQLASRVSAAPQQAQTTCSPCSVLTRLCTQPERSCERQFDRGEAHLLQVRPAVNDERDAAHRLGRARSLRPQGHGCHEDGGPDRKRSMHSKRCTVLAHRSGSFSSR